MMEIKVNCVDNHVHSPFYPKMGLKNGFIAENIGQIFVRTAPFIAKPPSEIRNYIGIPKPDRSSVDEESLQLVNIDSDGSLDFIVVKTKEKIHLPKDFNDKNWALAETFFKNLNEKDIQCAGITEPMETWSDWAFADLD